MKKWIFIFCILFPVMVSAQKLSVGIKPGLNLSHFWNQDGPDGSGRIIPGISAGVTFGYRPWERIGFTTEFNFTQRGAAYKFNVFGTTIRGINRVNYLEIPLLAEFYLFREGQFIPYFQFGPSFNFLTSARTRNIEPIDTETGSTSSFKNFDLGIVLGANLQMKFWKISVDPGIRYTLGLLDINTNGDPGKNGTFVIHAGIRYHFLE